MTKLPYDDLQAMKELLGKAGAAAPASVPQTRPDYDTNDLEDVGYEPPTQDQVNSPGFQAAAKYLKNSTPIVGQKAAELLGAYKAQENSRMPASEEPELTLDNTPEPQAQPSRQDTLSLLERYKQLTQNRQNANRNLDFLQGGNQIAQAIASGFGGKIGDGSEAVNQLRKSADLPVNDLLGQGKAVDLENDLQMNDPNSDISKFAREKAIAAATKAGMDPETVKKLEGMSAKQLEKLGLFSKTNTPQQQLRFERITGPDGVTRTVAINSQTGEIVKDIGQSGFASQFRINPETGGLVAVNPSNPHVTPIGVAGKSDNYTGTNQVQSTTQTPVSQSTTTQSTVEKKPMVLKDLSVKDQKRVEDTRSALAADPQYKKNQEAIDGAENAADLISMGADGGPDLVRAIQVMLAKASGNSGVLTEQDVEGYQGRANLMAKLDRMLEIASTGRLPEEDRKFLAKFAKTMGDSARRNLGQVTNQFTTQLSNDLGVDNSSAQNLLNIKERMGQSAPSGKITIQDSNGKSHVIDADKLEMAKKRDPGLKVVEGK